MISIIIFVTAFKCHDVGLHQAPTPNIGFSKVSTNFYLLLLLLYRIVYIFSMLEDIEALLSMIFLIDVLHYYLLLLSSSFLDFFFFF